MLEELVKIWTEDLCVIETNMGSLRIGHFKKIMMPSI